MSDTDGIKQTFLLILAQWRYMVTQMWVKTALGNGLLPDGNKRITATKVDLLSVKSLGDYPCTVGTFNGEYRMYQTT